MFVQQWRRANQGTSELYFAKHNFTKPQVLLCELEFTYSLETLDKNLKFLCFTFLLKFSVPSLLFSFEELFSKGFFNDIEIDQCIFFLCGGRGRGRTPPTVGSGCAPAPPHRRGRGGHSGPLPLGSCLRRTLPASAAWHEQQQPLRLREREREGGGARAAYRRAHCDVHASCQAPPMESQIEGERERESWAEDAPRRLDPRRVEAPP